MKQKNKILFLIDKKYPCNESFIEEVLSKRLGEYFKVFFLFNGKMKSTKWNKGVNIFFRISKVEKFLFNNFKIRLILSVFYYLSFYIKKIKPDFIYIRNDFCFLLLAFFLKKNQRIIFQKSFPNEKFKIYKLKKRNDIVSKVRIIIIKLKYRLLIKLINKCDYFIPITKCYLKELNDDGVKNNHKILPFPLGFDENFKFNVKIIKKIRTQYKLANYYSFIYIGVLDKERRIDTILDAFKEFQKFHDSKLIILAIGQEKNIMFVTNKILNDRIKNVILLSNLKRYDVYHFIHSVDYGLVPIPELDIYKISSPTKVVECLALNRPIITTNIPDCKYLINKTGLGIITNFNKQEIKNSMVKIINNFSVDHTSYKLNEDILKIRNYSKMTIKLVSYLLDRD